MFATPSSRLLFGVIPLYSVLIVIGICLALLIASREEKRLGLPQDTVIDAALWVIPSGVIGARLYYVIFAWDTFAADPISILYVWQGGLAIYGAVIGGFLGVLLFAHKRKLHLGTLTDIIAPGLILAQALGRWGNYFNMEAYGVQITDPAWQFFPAAVFIPSITGGAWHMATFFYESMWNLIVFAALMLSRKKMYRTGDTSLWYFLLYGTGRLVIEGLRTDSLYAGSTIRISQLLAGLMCLAVLIIFLHRTGLRKLLRLHSLPMICCIALFIALCIYLMQTGLIGIEVTTLLCAAFSLTTIVSSVTVYTAEG